jgi:hypothetical protein
VKGEGRAINAATTGQCECKQAMLRMKEQHARPVLVRPGAQHGSAAAANQQHACWLPCSCVLLFHWLEIGNRAVDA